MNGLAEGKAALEELRQFIGKSQLSALRELFGGEERQYFFEKVCELRDLVADPSGRISYTPSRHANDASKREGFPLFLNP